MIALIVLLLAGGSAFAETKGSVALLPLDADERLELYGQPVASEIARALVAGGVDVVVVGPKMAVPEKATLIVDGTIKAKGEAVVITLRVRKRSDGTSLDNLATTAPTIAALDKAASDISSRLLPSVVAKLAEQPAVVTPIDTKQPVDPHRVVVKKATLVAIAGKSALNDPLAKSVDRWIGAHDREPKHVDKLADVSELGIELSVRSYTTSSFTLEKVTIPTARATLHVKLLAGKAVVFDRTMFTDTVVGDRSMTPDALAARVADEIIAILTPHVRKKIGGWK